MLKRISNEDIEYLRLGYLNDYMENKPPLSGYDFVSANEKFAYKARDAQLEVDRKAILNFLHSHETMMSDNYDYKPGVWIDWEEYQQLRENK